MLSLKVTRPLTRGVRVEPQGSAPPAVGSAYPLPQFPDSRLSCPRDLQGHGSPGPSLPSHARLVCVAARGRLAGCPRPRRQVNSHAGGAPSPPRPKTATDMGPGAAQRYLLRGAAALSCPVARRRCTLGAWPCRVDSVCPGPAAAPPCAGPRPAGPGLLLVPCPSRLTPCQTGLEGAAGATSHPLRGCVSLPRTPTS